MDSKPLKGACHSPSLKQAISLVSISGTSIQELLIPYRSRRLPPSDSHPSREGVRGREDHSTSTIISISMGTLMGGGYAEARFDQLRASWRWTAPDHCKIRLSAVIRVESRTMAVAVMIRSAGSSASPSISPARMPMSPETGTSTIPNCNTFCRQMAAGCTKTRRRRCASMATSQKLIAETIRLSG